MKRRRVFFGNILRLFNARTAPERLFGNFLFKGSQKHCADDGADNQSNQVHQCVSNHRDDEDAAVGSHEGAAERHGERACHGGAHHTGREHMQWVGCREGDRALGDERQAHDEVHRAGFPLLLCEPVLEKQCCKSNGAGRYHAADHDCRHDVIVACGDGCGAEDVSRFIEGAAHVDGHHAGHDDAQKDPAGTAHVGQCGVQSRVQRADGRLYQELHDQAHEEDAAQRIQKHRRDLLYGLGQPGEGLDEEQHQVACDKACRQRAQEAGFACGSHHAADEAHGQSGTVRNAHGDKSGQDREHEAEGHVADAF